MRYQEYVKATNDIMSQYNILLTVRQIFYRLVSSGFIQNTINSYKLFDRMITRGREKGEIDARSIVDRARQVIGGDYGYGSVQDFVRSKISELEDTEQYTRRIWDDQPQYVEVWVEKDALATLFSTIADGYRVVTYPSRGYSSFTKVYEAINKRFSLYDDRPITILHFADHDPSGLNMTEDIQSRLYRYGSHARVKRVALTYVQVRQFGLEPMPTKISDSRWREYSSQYGNQCWELDALPPDELQNIIRDSIKAHIDVSRWNRTFKEIEKERRLLQKRFRSKEVTSLIGKLGLLLYDSSYKNTKKLSGRE
ncbi:MAG: hypothetical protein KGI33_08580 [Thaumarchaeota archaeon]|nr:hypothetical protein [Nitrososphaerota archaeon]